MDQHALGTHNGLEAMDMGVLPDEALCRTLWCLLSQQASGHLWMALPPNKPSI